MEETSKNNENAQLGIGAVSKSLNGGMITRQRRLAAACRRFQFEAIKSLRIFWLIEKIPWLKIKSPWDKLYKRSKR